MMTKSLQQGRCLRIELGEDVRDLATIEVELGEYFGKIELQLNNTRKSGEQI